MKKTLILLLAAVLCLSFTACGDKAENTQPTAAVTETPAPTESPKATETPVNTEAPEEKEAKTVSIYVTISSEGKLVTNVEELQVADADADGAFTINDALLTAHDALYEGGAEAGYTASEGTYGLSIEKLWGVENGGSYGYYVNNTSAYSLTDPIAEGDWLYAYSYADLTNWSDSYSYFDLLFAETDVGEELALTLSAAGFDANWNPITLSVAGAAITVNGETTEYLTAEDGTVKLSFDAAGTYLVSAESTESVIVPPVCVVTVG